MAEHDKTLALAQRRPGRASDSNHVSRFEPFQRVFVDDGWEMAEDETIARTTVALEQPRRVITRNTSPDLPFDRSINPYRGCEHGCIYCFARPTHAYLGLSPGLDFETRLIARPDAPNVLRRELSARRYQPATIAIGTNTDPYQPIEKTHEIMREILGVLNEFSHPVSIVTKGTLIERDLDILSDLAQRGLVDVGISITSLDRTLSRSMEPRAPAPARRLAVIENLARTGVPVRLMVAPVVPGLTDHELEKIIQAGAAAGADTCEWIMLRLPGEVSPLFQEWLHNNHPDRAARVMARVRETHGGKDYNADWGKRMRGEGTYADLIARRFDVAARRAGLGRGRTTLRRDLFTVPGRGKQLTLF